MEGFKYPAEKLDFFLLVEIQCHDVFWFWKDVQLESVQRIYWKGGKKSKGNQLDKELWPQGQGYQELKRKKWQQKALNEWQFAFSSPGDILPEGTISQIYPAA